MSLKESVKFFECLNSKNILNFKPAFSDTSIILLTNVIRFDRDLIDAKTNQLKFTETYRRFNENVNKRTDGLIVLDVKHDIRYKIKFFDSFECYYQMHDGDSEKIRFFSDDKVEIEMTPNYFFTIDGLWQHHKHSTSRPICEILLNQQTGNLLLFRILKDKYKADGSTKIKLLLTANNFSFYYCENVKKKTKRSFYYLNKSTRSVISFRCIYVYNLMSVVKYNVNICSCMY